MNNSSEKVDKIEMHPLELVDKPGMISSGPLVTHPPPPCTCSTNFL